LGNGWIPAFAAGPSKRKTASGRARGRKPAGIRAAQAKNGPLGRNEEEGASRKGAKTQRKRRGISRKGAKKEKNAKKKEERRRKKTSNIYFSLILQ
jgi:hypothetical protein